MHTTAGLEPSASCGRRSLTIWRPSSAPSQPAATTATRAWLPPRRWPCCARARGGALEKDCAFPLVAGKGGRTFELLPCLVVAAEPDQQVPAHTRQKVVALERRLVGERVDTFQARCRAVGHGDRDRLVEPDHRRRHELGECLVKRRDLCPVGVLAGPRLRVARRDRGLQHVRAGRGGAVLRTQECRETTVDEELIPAPAILLKQRDGLAGRPGPRRSEEHT